MQIDVLYNKNPFKYNSFCTLFLMAQRLCTKKEPLGNPPGGNIKDFCVFSFKFEFIFCKTEKLGFLRKYHITCFFPKINVQLIFQNHTNPGNCEAETCRNPLKAFPPPL